MGEFARTYKTDLTDRQLMGFWGMMQATGRDRAVAYCLPPLDAHGFVRWMRQDYVHPWFVTWQGQPVGFAYLTNMEGKSARIHFGTLPQGIRRMGNRKLSVVHGFGLYILGSLLWEQTVSGGYRLDTIIGLTPVVNKEAVRFIKRCGAQECGVIPGACYYHDTGENVPGLVTTYTRETVPGWARVL